MKLIEWKEIYSCYKNNQVFSYFAESKTSAISVGSFDGLHLGHRKLMASLKENSVKNNYLAGVFTFTRPLPSYKHSSDYSGDISTLDQRLKLFEDVGIDFVIVSDFNPEFAALKGIEFFDIIKSVCNLKFIVEGIDFRCGYKGATDTQSLKYWAEQNEIGYSFIEPVYYKETDSEEERISSSYIRTMIQKGFFSTVNELLLRPYEIDLRGLKYVHKKNILQYSKTDIMQVLPKDGIYRGTVENQSYRIRINEQFVEIEGKDDSVSFILF